MLTRVNFPTFAMADLCYGGPSLSRADTVSFYHKNFLRHVTGALLS